MKIFLTLFVQCYSQNPIYTISCCKGSKMCDVFASVCQIIFFLYLLTRIVQNNKRLTTFFTCNTQCLNVSTTPITAMGCRQCLSFSVVQLKGKQCRKPHYRNGVVDRFRQGLFHTEKLYGVFGILSIFISQNSTMTLENDFWWKREKR